MLRLRGWPKIAKIVRSGCQVPVWLRRLTVINFGNLLVLVLLFLAGESCAGAAVDFRVDQQKGTDLILVITAKAGSHKLEIDDAFEFRTPLLVRTFSGTSF